MTLNYAKSSDAIDLIPTQRRTSMAPWIVAAITLVAYLPAVFNNFVAWDDATFITSNPRFNPASWATVHYYWVHAGANLYMPLTYSLWALLAKIAYVQTPDAMGTRLNPYVFHLMGVLLHVLATMAVFAIVRHAIRATGAGRRRADWAAGIGSLLFGLHPLQVESVAFIGTMNTPLAAALGLWAVWLYLCSLDLFRAADMSRDRFWSKATYLTATFLFLASMLCKPTAVVVPPIALLLDLAVNRTPWRKAIRSILPWVVLVVPCVIWTKLFQHGAAVHSALWVRPFIAGDAFAFYLGKLIFPFNLGIDYGLYPAVVQINAATYIIWAVPVALLVWAWFLRKSWPMVAAAIVIFFVALLPNSGIVPFDYQQISTTADRYVYLAMLGPALAVAVLFAVRWNRTMLTWGVLILVGWCALTQVQIQTWRNGEALFSHAIAVNPDTWMARINLANIVMDRSPDEGIALCRDALAHRPNSAQAYNNLGSALMLKKESAAAEHAFEQAHKLSPGTPLFARNYARALAQNAGKADERLAPSNSTTKPPRGE